MTLTASQLNLTELFNVLVDAVVGCDQDQRIVYFNRGAEKIFGYTAEEVIDQPLDILLPERFVEIHRRHFAAFLASPIPSKAMGERQPIFARAKDGREFPAEAAIAKLRRGADTLSIVIMRDVTERRQLEAELRRQAEQAAVEAERNRIARDLHDAVTQTLFSVSVIADVLPRIWERNPAEGKRRLEELRQLSRGALAEMRTLLLELRPASLVEASLPDLLRQLSASITSRARVSVEVRINGDASDIPPEIKVSLYRIAQEALNNVAKHSGASKAEVVLTVGAPNGKEPHIALSVRDDGCGFDPTIAKPTHLGLNIMRERAAAIGAALRIESQPGKGTLVHVEVHPES
ncbi:MAG: PAS domain-containing sensor histidine kinase [Anaerolineae bacterium]|nr:PAS domain-containing sensor histidine kinase [Thermoflexales bacterium]MDW8396466.1 PAS domain-containing sensor histidine kinase [Anaerolineae bacterium]